jgi:RWD domain
MADHHAEEQEMEAEALAAIFDVHFGSLPNDNDKLYNHYWFIDIYPEAASDPDELNKLNHVAIKLLARIPKSYPEGDDNDGNGCLPMLEIQLLKGLVPDPHESQLLDIATQEAQANQGAPSIFAIVERLREWLVEHNRPGLDDVSMHAQMIMRQKEQEKLAAKKSAAEAAAVSLLLLRYYLLTLFGRFQFFFLLIGRVVFRALCSVIVCVDSDRYHCFFAATYMTPQSRIPWILLLVLGVD